MTEQHPTLAMIRSHLPELVAIRRDIHAHPEMGLEEVRTSALVAAKLREWGVEVTEGVGKTGVVGTIKGKLPGQRAILDGPNFLVPTGPGLGIEVDEKVLRREAFRFAEMPKLRRRDGSFTNW